MFEILELLLQSKNFRRRVSYHTKIVPPYANYGHSLGLLNCCIQENIEAFLVGTHPLVPKQ